MDEKLIRTFVYYLQLPQLYSYKHVVNPISCLLFESFSIIRMRISRNSRLDSKCKEINELFYLIILHVSMKCPTPSLPGQGGISTSFDHLRWMQGWGFCILFRIIISERYTKQWGISQNLGPQGWGICSPLMANPHPVPGGGEWGISLIGALQWSQIKTYRYTVL